MNRDNFSWKLLRVDYGFQSCWETTVNCWIIIHESWLLQKVYRFFINFIFLEKQFMKEDYQNIEDSAPYLSIPQEPFIFEHFKKSIWCWWPIPFIWECPNLMLTHIGESRKLFPKNGRLHRGYPGNFFQTFSRLKFWVMRQGMTHEAGDVPETIPRWISWVRDPSQLCSAVTSQYGKNFFWKKFPENPLSHAR